MSLNSEDKYFIAFASIEEIGGAFIKKLLEIKGNIESAWNIAKSDFTDSGLRVTLVEKFLRKRDSIDPDKLYNYTVENGIKWITYNDKNYPFLLKEITPTPMVLFYKGDLDNVNFNKTLSIVGSRKASIIGKENLGRIIKGFYGTDLTIVSGGAIGIDTCAHKNAIDNNLSTIVVLGSGLEKIYPTQNKKMFDDIVQKNGIIMSEFWHDFEPLPFRFPIRNRVVAGLSKGTLVAEAAIKSGAMITANLCLDQNRELMCMPGDINNPNTQGIYHLLKNGASLVTCADDIIEVMGWEKFQVKESSKTCLSEVEQNIIAEINIDALNIDELSNRLKINVTDLMATLTTMELSGLIKQIDGERYISNN